MASVVAVPRHPPLHESVDNSYFTLGRGMSHKSLLAGAFVSICIFLGALAPANANTFNWTYTGTDAWDGTTSMAFGWGVLTTGNAVGNSGGVTITSFTGTWSNSSSRDPNWRTIHYFGAGQDVLYPTNPQLLDAVGVSFIGVFDWDLTWDSTRAVTLSALATGGYAASSCSLPYCQFFSYTEGTFTISPVQAVPGPVVGAGIPGLIVAGGGLLGWWRRRQKTA